MSVSVGGKKAMVLPIQVLSRVLASGSRVRIATVSRASGLKIQPSLHPQFRDSTYPRALETVVEHYCVSGGFISLCFTVFVGGRWINFLVNYVGLLILGPDSFRVRL